MSKREQFVDELRTWLGTPFHHLGRAKGAGVDCVGLVAAAMKNIEAPVEDLSEYPKQPVNGMFRKVVEAQSDPVATLADAMIGDVITFRFTKEEQHIAVIVELVPHVKIIHAHASAGMCVEHYLDDYWKERMVSIRRPRGLD